MGEKQNKRQDKMNINNRPFGKNPRTQDSFDKPKILRENPRSDNALAHNILTHFVSSLNCSRTIKSGVEGFRFINSFKNNFSRSMPFGCYNEKRLNMHSPSYNRLLMGKSRVVRFIMLCSD